MFNKKSFYWINKTNSPSANGALILTRLVEEKTLNRRLLAFVILSLFITLIIYQIRWVYAQAFGDEPITSPITVPITSPVSPTPTPTAEPTPTPSPTPLPTPFPDTESPVVSITYPLNGQTVKRKSFVNIQASASDDKQVARVEFYVNGILKCSDAYAGYSCNWHVPKKVKVFYNIQAVAYDTSGNYASSIVTVKSAKRQLKSAKLE